MEEQITTDWVYHNKVSSHVRYLNNKISHDNVIIYISNLPGFYEPIMKLRYEWSVEFVGNLKIFQIPYEKIYGDKKYKYNEIGLAKQNIDFFLKKISALLVFI